MTKEKYKKIEIDFQLTEELESAINDLMRNINKEDGRLEDCYRSEIDFWLRDALQIQRITRDQYHLLSMYYVYGGIYKELGNPAYGRGKGNGLKTQNL